MEQRGAVTFLVLVVLAVFVVTLSDAAPSGLGRPALPEAPQEPHRRVRRQNGEVVESIFQIPIQTLMAVSKVFTTGIQSFQRTREQFFQATRPGTTSLTSSPAYNYQQQLLQQQQQPNRPYNRPNRPYSGGSYSSAFSSVSTTLNNRPNYAYYNYNNRPRAGSQQQQSQAASVAGVSTQSDGSSYRI